MVYGNISLSYKNNITTQWSYTTQAIGSLLINIIPTIIIFTEYFTECDVYQDFSEVGDRRKCA